MGKKNATSRRSSAKTTQQGDDSKLHAAEEKVRRARAALQQAEEVCRQMRRQAAEQVERLRETSLGDMLDSSLELVRKHPGLGVTDAIAAGFFLGRLFRR